MRKFTPFLLFAIVSLFVFWLTFGPVGSFLSHLFASPFQFIWSQIPITIGVIDHGVLPVIHTVLSFLPQVFILFTALELFKRFKFSQNLLPYMMGFGCTTLAVASHTPTRTRTATLSFIPCSAKIPVILIFVNSFFEFPFYVIFVLYVLTIVVVCVVATCFPDAVSTRVKETKCTLCNESSSLETRKENQVSQPFSILKTSLNQTLKFLHKLGPPILLVTIALYYLSHYTFHLQYTTEPNQSILYNIARVFSPFFAPLGLGNGAVVATLVLGLLGKELIVAGLESICTSIFSPASAFAFLVFVMLYPVCMNAFITIKNHHGKRFAATLAALNFAVAWVVAFFAHRFVLITGILGT